MVFANMMLIKEHGLGVLGLFFFFSASLSLFFPAHNFLLPMTSFIIDSCPKEKAIKICFCLM